METARCRAFVTAAESGSFSRAAEILAYTPSGVSQLVNALEGELGFALLIRTKRGVTLTENGERLLPAIREFLAQEARVGQLAADIRGLTVGAVTIATYTSVAAHWLPELIRSFQLEYPQIEIALMEGIRQEVSAWVSERRADVGFLSYQEPMEFEWIPLAEDRMLAVLPREHPRSAGETYPLRECVNERFIMPALGRDDDVASMLERNDLKPDIKFTTVEDFSALSMIEKGLGMSIMNELITKNWVCDVAMLPLDPPQSITLGLVLPSLRNAAPAVRKFVEHAVKSLTTVER